MLDDSTRVLEDSLSDLNIVVIVPPANSIDKHRRVYLAGRILVTTCADRYVEDATSYEFGLIGMPKGMMADPVTAAKAISRAIVKHGLWALGHSFVLNLGTGILRDLWAEEQGAGRTSS